MSTFSVLAPSATAIFFSPSALFVPVNPSCDCLTSGYSAIVAGFAFADSTVSGAFASCAAAGDGLTVSIFSSFTADCLGVGSYISFSDSRFASCSSTAGFDSAGFRSAALSGATLEAGIVYSVVACSA